MEQEAEKASLNESAGSEEKQDKILPHSYYKYRAPVRQSFNTIDNFECEGKNQNLKVGRQSTLDVSKGKIAIKNDIRRKMTLRQNPQEILDFTENSEKSESSDDDKELLTPEIELHLGR